MHACLLAYVLCKGFACHWQVLPSPLQSMVCGVYLSLSLVCQLYMSVSLVYGLYLSVCSVVLEHGGMHGLLSAYTA